MEKIVKNGLRDCTVILDGSECAVKFDTCFRAFAVRNDGAADVYISKSSGIVPDADGVMCVKSGASAVFAHMDIYADTVYLIGSSKVQVHGQQDSNNPFNFAPTMDGGVQASGNPVVMDNLQGGVPFSEMIVSGDDIIGQDLTVKVSGKNLIPYPYQTASKSVGNLNIEINDNGEIIINGSHTSDVWIDLCVNKISGNYIPLFKGKTYKLSGVPKNSETYMQMVVNKSDGTRHISLYSGTYDSPAYTVPEDGMYGLILIKCPANVTYSNFIIKPQLEFGDTATPYEPYNGSTTTITPNSNPYTIQNDIRQVDGLNVVSVSEGEISVTGVRKNAAVKKIWDKIDELTTAIIVSNGESE